MLRALTVFLFAASAAAQSADQGKAELQQRVAAIRQSIARNQQQLRQYSWTETVEMVLKGETKKREQNECSYGPDGKVVKNPIGTPPAPSAKKGLKGKIAKNKIEDLKEYMDRVGSLMRRYVPPDPQAMQAAFQSGKASLTPGSGVVTFVDYAKPGDKVTLAFDVQAKVIRSFNVATYLDDPKDAVNLQADFSALPDGTNYLEHSVLVATAKELQIKTTNSGYHK
jgi:hypothetical protein